MLSSPPKFFILGAQKAGTTTLHRWLIQQSELCLPRRKETHFFSHDERFALGKDWYFKQFQESGNDKIVGEIDPEYLFFPKAALRIRDFGLSPRFIVIVREPLRRAFSQYRMSLSRGLESLSFSEALRHEKKRISSGEMIHLNHHSYMARGEYAKQIEHYRKIFPNSTIKVIRFETLFSKESNIQEFTNICNFIGIKSIVYPKITNKKYNSSSAERLSILNELIWRKNRWNGLRKIVGWMLPSREIKYNIAYFLDYINKRAVTFPDDWRKKVDNKFLIEAERQTELLAQATGLDFTCWEK